MEKERRNIFKGKTEDEIKKAFNQKWLEIINNCTYKKRKETPKSCLHQSDNHGIMKSTENQTCSANLKKEELNKI